MKNTTIVGAIATSVLGGALLFALIAVSIPEWSHVRLGSSSDLGIGLDQACASFYRDSIVVPDSIVCMGLNLAQVKLIMGPNPPVSPAAVWAAIQATRGLAGIGIILTASAIVAGTVTTVFSPTKVVVPSALAGAAALFISMALIVWSAGVNAYGWSRVAFNGLGSSVALASVTVVLLVIAAAMFGVLRLASNTSKNDARGAATAQATAGAVAVPMPPKTGSDTISAPIISRPTVSSSTSSEVAGPEERMVAPHEEVAV